MPTFMLVDMRATYASCRGRVLDLVDTLPPADADRPVPGTPGWTVRDVVAHLAGVAADVTAGRIDGAGTPPWTARQVAERADVPMAEIVQEWRGLGPSVDPVVSAAPRIAFDALVHEQDLRCAVGLDGPGDHDAADAAVQIVIDGLGRRLERAGAPALRVVAGETEWIIGPGEPAATLRLPFGELFRVLFGRRSEAQVRACSWEGDPAPYLALLSVFGPLPEADVVE